MLLQTNSYIVPREKREEHARLVRKFRQVLHRLGCDNFEIYEQVGSNWSTTETTGRYVQIMRFRDRKHQQQVQAAEREDRGAQAVIREFCELINFPYQLQQGLFASGFYQSVLPVSESHRPEAFKGKVTPVMPPNSPTTAPAAPGEPVEPAPAEQPPADAMRTGEGSNGTADDVINAGAQPGEDDVVEGEAVEFDIDLDDDTPADASGDEGISDPNERSQSR